MKATRITLIQNLVIDVYPNEKHGFLASSNAVAACLNIQNSTLRSHIQRNKDEFVENIHFIRGDELTWYIEAEPNAQSTKVFWTKVGLIRLASHSRGANCILLRNWAEGQCLAAWNKRDKQVLDRNWLEDIMRDVCMIQDHDLRARLTQKLLGK